MTRRLAGVAAGIRGALRVPEYLEGERWRELLTPPASVPTGREAPAGTGRCARGALRLLAALPGGRWKRTCLYRSVAECLALRHFGVPAVVRIGVRAGTGTETPVMAHAWVVADPAAEPPPPDRMHAFPVRS